MSVSAIPASRLAGETAAADTAAPIDQKTMKAAQDFEAMAIGQLLEPMFATVDTSKSMFGGGEGEQSFKPMLVTEMAKQVEQRGGLGLADDIYKQMIRMQESRK
ncbi:rod-binding protein [Acetobacteraceae bacterium KSS8]|uniref:Rod-binding protein n=1 Tax=Endosaccharibacter trunci TaxID=2812733 RepID=A0ABT1W9V3_9PROT|nr:rod-binding protein [Acetobacteraceae bacterium KSS8]